MDEEIISGLKDIVRTGKRTVRDVMGANFFIKNKQL